MEEGHASLSRVQGQLKQTLWQWVSGEEGGFVERGCQPAPVIRLLGHAVAPPVCSDRGRVRRGNDEVGGRRIDHREPGAQRRASWLRVLRSGRQGITGWHRRHGQDAIFPYWDGGASRIRLSAAPSIERATRIGARWQWDRLDRRRRHPDRQGIVATVASLFAGRGKGGERAYSDGDRADRAARS
jgi:hypothetical protein